MVLWLVIILAVFFGLITAFIFALIFAFFLALVIFAVFVVVIDRPVPKIFRAIVVVFVWIYIE